VIATEEVIRVTVRCDGRRMEAGYSLPVFALSNSSGIRNLPKIRGMRTRFASLLLSATLVVGGAHAQSAACPDAADESHHQVLYQNDSTRVLLLDLPRLASTASHAILIPIFT
jgi:hypothetical protein